MSNEATWFENALSAMTTKGEAYSEKAGRAVLTNVCEERLTTLKEKIENIDGIKEGECAELLAKDHVLTLIEEELQ